MLTTGCINPHIMEVLAYCGHGSKILIADGNYPLREKSGSAEKVYLGIYPGLPKVTDVLHTLLSVVNFERAEVMVPEEGEEPQIFAEFRKELNGMNLERLSRSAFYQACMDSSTVVLAISTGEQRTFANILLTVACA